eukprot:TRINITY_DN6151_c0_g1_i7.p2 TRINITY_DN6151_c0_g1~~TRINITY_DN6151_c0_g1_i7.p2  ORF type:complete len:633 (+),score=120.53 TRINITY_DN6151_c0_g1_i7:433-2331(+)
MSVFWVDSNRFVVLMHTGEGFLWYDVDGIVYGPIVDYTCLASGNYQIKSVMGDRFYVVSENADQICQMTRIGYSYSVDSISALHFYVDESRVLFLNETSWGTISSGEISTFSTGYTLDNTTHYFSTFNEEDNLWVIGDRDACRMVLISLSNTSVSVIHNVCSPPLSIVASPMTPSVLYIVTNTSMIVSSLEGTFLGEIQIGENIVECVEVIIASPSIVLLHYRNVDDMLSIISFDVSSPSNIFSKKLNIMSVRNNFIPDQYRMSLNKDNMYVRYFASNGSATFYIEEDLSVPIPTSSTTEESSSSSSLTSQPTHMTTVSLQTTMESTTTPEVSSTTTESETKRSSDGHSVSSSLSSSEAESSTPTEDIGNCATSDCRSCKEGYYGLKCDQTESGIFPLINCVSKIGNIYKVHFGYINSNPGSPIGDDFASLLVIDDTTSEDITIDITKKNNHFAFSRECELSIDWTLGERDVSFTSDSFDSSIMCRAEAKVILRLRNRNGPVSEGTLTNISHAIANYLGISPESVSVKNIDSKKRQTNSVELSVSITSDTTLQAVESVSLLEDSVSDNMFLTDIQRALGDDNVSIEIEPLPTGQEIEGASIVPETRTDVERTSIDSSTNLSIALIALLIIFF